MIKIGDKLGNFLIQAEIGRGGMGTIYYAMDTMLNREVALKVIHPQLADNQQLMERFKIEAMTQARLNHPNIVMIFSFNCIDGVYIIVMEYVEGQSLKELLEKKKQFHPAEAIDIIVQVAEGLGYAHAHNVIHRDIKPANILLGRDNKVKLSDFGIAKIFGAQGLTKTGMLIGTPWYISPEQIMGKNIDFRTDLYSLGITFYELLTGRVPFDSDSNSEFQIQQAHLETPPPRPSIYNPEIGIKLEKFILQALQKKVEKRFQNAREMIDELQHIRADLTKAGMANDAEVTQRIVTPVKKRHLSLLTPLNVVAFLLLLLAGVVLLIFLSSKSGMDEGKNEAVDKLLPLAETTSTQDAAVVAANDIKNVGEKKRVGETHDPLAVDTPAAENPSALPPVGQPAAQPGISLPKKENAAEAKPAAPAPDQGSIPREKPAKAIELGRLDDDLSRLRGFLKAQNFIAADSLADTLVSSGVESRAYPLLGKVKFMLNQFDAAEKLWRQALQANHLINLEIMHLHAGPGDYCLGQLQFKRKVILFNSDARGDHSFALMAGNIGAVTLDNGRRITISGSVNGQEIDESFMLANKIRKREKEKFLVDFLNQHVL
jgi:serine/threonine protein kinase